MIVTKIELSNFRNYDSLSLELDDKTNILYGKNAQGKTNVLEAIYLCSTTKSHRSSKDAELIKFENNEGHIKLFINKKGGSCIGASCKIIFDDFLRRHYPYQVHGRNSRFLSAKVSPFKLPFQLHQYCTILKGR